MLGKLLNTYVKCKLSFSPKRHKKQKMLKKKYLWVPLHFVHSKCFYRKIAPISWTRRNQKKSKCISSPEQNYFSIFAMRYTVVRSPFAGSRSSRTSDSSGTSKTSRIPNTMLFYSQRACFYSLLSFIPSIRDGVLRSGMLLYLHLILK